MLNIHLWRNWAFLKKSAQKCKGNWNLWKEQSLHIFLNKIVFKHSKMFIMWKNSIITIFWWSSNDCQCPTWPFLSNIKTTLDFFVLSHKKWLNCYMILLSQENRRINKPKSLGRILLYVLFILLPKVSDENNIKILFWQTGTLKNSFSPFSE